ncbi:MAG: biopolymer transporter ExbD [Pseudomonadota bacterium]
MRIFHKPKPEDIINITPLIDVVFILLVFFMVAGAIDRPDPIDVTTPQSESEQAGDIEDVVILIGPDGSVAFQGEVMPTDPALVQTATLWFAVRPDSSIQLKADADADAARVIEVMELLREAGAQYLVLLTVGGEAAP